MPVTFVRNLGTRVHLGRYFVEMLPESGVTSSEEYFVHNGQREIPFASCGVIQPGQTLDASAASLIRTPLIIVD